MCEINEASPRTIKHLVGQAGVIRQVEVALDASFQDNKSFPSSLLVGPPGCGKSQVASLVAAEMATDYHETLGQSITCIADLNALLLQAGERASYTSMKFTNSISRCKLPSTLPSTNGNCSSAVVRAVHRREFPSPTSPCYLAPRTNTVCCNHYVTE